MHQRTIVWAVTLGVITLMFLELPQIVARQDTVLQTYGALVEVDALARQQFVHAIRDDRLVDGAIRGMMQALDPYSGYVAPDELADFRRRRMGEYTGIGVELGMRDGALTVIAPIDGSPAAHAGAAAGDVIRSIDGVPVRGMSVFDVDALLHGAPGTRVVLSVRRRGVDGTVPLTITRGVVRWRTVRGCRRSASGGWEYMLDPRRRIGYVRISDFGERVSREFDAALNALHAAGAEGLIIDLRFNPGGLMAEAVKLVDRFVRDGLIVSTVTRRKAVAAYHATPEGTDTEMELAVLINGGSASSSEIVAGSLQDRGRAIIVGTRSFGKGSAQQLMYLKERAAAIKLTVAHYRLPSGRIIHRAADAPPSAPWGILPDIPVPLDGAAVAALQRSRAALDRAAAVEPRAEASGPSGVREESGVSGVSAPPAGGCTDPGLLEPAAGMILADCQLVAAHRVLAERLARRTASAP
ncbi:MAG: S41 family peptidase [Phycisphaerae bacterium]